MAGSQTTNSVLFLTENDNSERMKYGSALENPLGRQFSRVFVSFARSTIAEKLNKGQLVV